MVPAGARTKNPRPGWHQNGTGIYDFKLLGSANGVAGNGGPTPLVQLWVGFVITDLSEPGACQLAAIPGSHNSITSFCLYDMF